MKILVISDNYPSRKNPTNGIFLYNLVQRLCKMNHEVTVISPFQLVPRKVFSKSVNYGDELATVYRPLYTSLSAKNIGNFNTYWIARKLQVLGIRKTIAKYNIQYDVVYSHFVKNALLTLEAIPNIKVPVIAAVGENRNLDLVKSWYPNSMYNNYFSKIDGFVAVSQIVKDKLLSRGAEEERIIIAPNGVDPDVYYKKENKTELRKKYNIPNDKVIITFVGHFIPDKGPHKILEAVEDIDNISIVLIGNGSLVLESDKIVHKGRVERNLVPEYLSLSDIFVLPTMHEGSSNAIVEAMSCGLPIISSDIPEVRVQCKDGKNSILVDPNNVSELEDAIRRLVSDKELRMKMGNESLVEVKKFMLPDRARKITDFISSFIND